MSLRPALLAGTIALAAGGGLFYYNDQTWRVKYNQLAEEKDKQIASSIEKMHHGIKLESTAAQERELQTKKYIESLVKQTSDCRAALSKSETLRKENKKEGGVIIPPSAQHFFPFGIPSTENIRFNQDYVVAYDTKNRTAFWSAEHISKVIFSKRGSPDRQNSQFKEDERFPAIFRALLTDYQGSGFDRGHLTPAADVISSQESLNETFLLSNISPQVGDGFNRHYWARLEKFARMLVDQYEDVYIYSGPLYLPEKSTDGKWYVHHQVLGNPPNVSVPTHFFKTILVTKPIIEDKTNLPADAQASNSAIGDPAPKKLLKVATFILPNKSIPQNTPLDAFLVDETTLARATGMLFWRRALPFTVPLCTKETPCNLPPTDWWKPKEAPVQVDVDKVVTEFLSNPNVVEYKFPTAFTSFQRKQAHEAAEKYNLDHVTKVDASGTYVVITKSPITSCVPE